MQKYFNLKPFLLTAFNNEQNPHPIVSYKRPRNDKCKTIQTKKLLA